jgi:hypothetical protein
MKTVKIVVMFVSVLTLLTACQKEKGCTNPLATNYDANATDDDGSCLFDASPAYEIPTTYTFVDASGNSTVDFNGQAQRLEMLTEMSDYIKTANLSGTVLSASVIKDMYANNGVDWLDMDALGMDGSSKNLKSKTAASTGTADPAIQAYFESLMDDMAALSGTTVADNPTGGPGVGGVVVSTTNPSKMYLQNAFGHEYSQFIEKGLMGAVFYNQLTDYYFSEGEMDVDNSVAVDADNGKYYTLMEHHWDEAYGYFTTATDYPSNGADRFWGKYTADREGLMGSASIIQTAFLTGRAAISNNDLNTRDAQIDIIRTELERVAAATAIHYLNGALENIADHAIRNHELSEAFMFMDALGYGHNPAYSLADIAALQAQIGDDFYDVSAQDITSVIDQLAEAFDLMDIADIL